MMGGLEAKKECHRLPRLPQRLHPRQLPKQRLPSQRLQSPKQVLEEDLLCLAKEERHPRQRLEEDRAGGLDLDLVTLAEEEGQAWEGEKGGKEGKKGGKGGKGWPEEGYETESSQYEGHGGGWNRWQKEGGGGQVQRTTMWNWMIFSLINVTTFFSKKTHTHTKKKHRTAKPRRPMGLGRAFWQEVLDLDTDWVMIECNLNALTVLVLFFMGWIAHKLWQPMGWIAHSFHHPGKDCGWHSYVTKKSKIRGPHCQGCLRSLPAFRAWAG